MTAHMADQIARRERALANVDHALAHEEYQELVVASPEERCLAAYGRAFDLLYDALEGKVAEVEARHSDGREPWDEQARRLR